MQVKQTTEDKKKRGTVCEVICKDCECVYIGETSSPLENHLSEHKNVMKNMTYTNHGIAAHAWNNQHRVDWKAARQEDWKETTER